MGWVGGNANLPSCHMNGKAAAVQLWLQGKKKSFSKDVMEPCRTRQLPAIFHNLIRLPEAKAEQVHQSVPTLSPRTPGRSALRQQG